MGQRTVLFLGAGASRALGYPVTSQIMPRVINGLKDGASLFPRHNVAPPVLGEHALVNSHGFLADASAVLRTDLLKLFPGILDEEPAPQVTDILSLLDHLIITGTSAIPGAADEGLAPAPARQDTSTRLGFTRERLARVRMLLERAIATVITAPEETRTGGERMLVDRLVEWIVAACNAPAPHLITIITTNYDLAVEGPVTTAIRAAYGDQRIDYGFNWREPGPQEEGEEVVRVRPANPAVAIYKLHGSINWLRCPLCEHVYVNQYGAIFDLAFASRARSANTCTCYHWPLGTLIVAPSVIRDIRDPSLLSIWQSALEALRLAQRWVVIGYSLPPEDVVIRSLLLRASRAREHPPVVDVYDVGPQLDLQARFRLLLRQIQYHPGGLEEFVASLP